ncbi:DUF86 domain-containing protein [Candidatus Gottesmanbacteria bacterium]|nr:DUF86 domain-containing protein [Candidatus Gottesmanbacteria bacterium]
MIDREMIEKKIDLILADLVKLGEFRDVAFDDIAKDYWKHKAVERVLEVIVGEAIDINQHLIVKSGMGELPFDFTESFNLLVKLGVYPEDFAQTIAKSVGLRNILVHQYRKLDEQLFYASIKDCLMQYTQYCRYITDYLEQVKENTA